LRNTNAEAADEVEAMVKRNSEGLIENYGDVLARLNEKNAKLSKYGLDLLTSDVQKFYDELFSLYNNPDWSADMGALLKETITNYRE